LELKLGPSLHGKKVRHKSATDWDHHLLAGTGFLRTQYWIIGDVKRNIAPYLLTLANRNNPICVTSPKVAMASTMAVTIVRIFAHDIVLNIANVNTA
jgi:hypothetical protein